MDDQNISFLNKYGFCVYSEKCRRYQENTICERSQCERECQQRHPKICNSFLSQDLGFYKRMVQISHNVHKNNEDVKKLEDKLATVEIELKKKNDKVLMLEEEIKDMHLKMSKKEKNRK